MAIKEFAEIIREKMEERTGLEVRLQDVTKNNGIVFHGLNIMKPGCNVIPTIYLEHYLDAYEGGIDLDVILDHIEETVHSNNRPNNLNMDWFRDWEKVKGKVAYRLINYEANKELLKDIPHEKFLDLAKVYYVSVNAGYMGSGTILIRNNHMEIWGITTEQLEKAAGKNTPKLFPAVIDTMSKVLAELLGEIEAEEDKEIIDKCGMYLISNSNRFHGAATLCYSSVIKDFANKVNSNLFILPSSLHEIIIVLGDDIEDVARFKCMVYEVNRTQLAEEDILSDSVYYYNRELDTISVF